MADEELRTLVSKRAVIKRQITQFSNYLANITPERMSSEIALNLEIKVRNIQKACDVFDSIQSQIELLDTENETQLLDRENTIGNIVSCVTRANSLISSYHSADNASDRASTSSQQSVQSTRSGTDSALKLPTMQLPTFNGSYETWVEFRDMFVSLIHNNSELTNIQKLFYLRSALAGDAAAVISTIQSSNDNYTVAWDALLHRYNNSQLIINNHMKSLFDTQPLAKETSIGLRSLIDVFKNNLRALKNLKQPTDSWDTIMIFLVTSKLDTASKRDWEEKRVHLPDPVTFQHLLDHLTARCNVLETLKSNTTTVSDANKRIQTNTNSNSSHRNYVKPNGMQSKQNSTNSYMHCYLCGSRSHFIHKCESFLSQDVNKRIATCKTLNLCTNCLHTGHFANQCKASHCRKCAQFHNTLLHPANSATQSATSTSLPTVANLNVHHSSYAPSEILLSTAQVIVRDRSGNQHYYRVLLDSGSQTNFVSESLVKRLRLETRHSDLKIFGINGMVQNSIQETKIHIESHCSSFNRSIKCIVLPNITQHLPIRSFNRNMLPIPNHIKLADPRYNLSSPVDILIGAELFYSLLLSQRIHLGRGLPTLQNTLLGWIVGGALPGIQHAKQSQACTAVLESMVSKFWEQDTFSTSNKVLKVDELACENHFKSTFCRDENGKFVVRIPFKENLSSLTLNRSAALSRFYSLEKGLERNPTLKKAYHEFMIEYISLNHMTEVKNASDSKFYLPHHAVVRESGTTKVRVVFDGSTKSCSGVSLNDVQLVGPVVHNDLYNILVNFRMHQYVLTADIQKMYRQILVHPDDRSYQRIFWRFNKNSELKTYELNTVTYGTSSAPFLATRCLVQLATECKDKYPKESAIIIDDTYVDDILTGADEESQLLQIRQNLSNLLSLAGFSLHKWFSNSALLTNGDTFDHTLNLTDHENKPLGVRWNNMSDVLHFANCLLSNSRNQRVTKRFILSSTAKIYDPLGLISPITIIAKILLQDMWKYKLDWDTEVPVNIKTLWSKFSLEFSSVTNIKIPRCTVVPNAEIIELHGFADASEKAYGACIYVRSISKSRVSCNLLTSKTRVAPLSSTTLPRLELCAALLLARLMFKIKSILKISSNKTYYLTDSTIALNWINGHPSRWKTYVANRVAEVQELSNIFDWHHIKSELNPADILSRGQCPDQLANNELWWHGPEFLSTRTEVTYEKIDILNNVSEQRVTLSHHISQKQNDFELIHKYSSHQKLLRITALCLRFIHNLRSNEKITSHLTVSELEAAELVIVKVAQLESFAPEIKLLQSSNQLTKSKLINLSPFLDQHGVLRVGGRIQESHQPYNFKHQMLLESKHHLTIIIATELHQRLNHCGPQQLLYAFREKFWVTNGRSCMRMIFHKCIKCYKTKPIEVKTLTGNLPKDRIVQVAPFSVSGTDFAGPLYIRDRRARGYQPVKIYVCIFICFVTKAVHLEIVSDLTTEAFIACFRRFVARRGLVKKLYSDNGRNYVGANKELKRLHEFLLKEQQSGNIQRTLNAQGITWHFIPPRSPHFGGIWESNIKSLKNHLKRTIGNEVLSYENFHTVLTQIEAVLNSRPLTPLNSSPNELAPLTPGHFLVGRPLTSLPNPDTTHIQKNKLSCYQLLQNMVRNFWTRWHKEYLSELQNKSRQPSKPVQLKPGDVVLIKESNIPPMQWKMGLIQEVHPGNDGSVRVATVRTNEGIITRSSRYLCLLPIDDSQMPETDEPTNNADNTVL